MAWAESRSSEGYCWTPTGSTQGLETKAVIATSAHRADSYDVVVLGAGFAGLVAARNITQQTNARVLLLEARDRIGGRTWTAKVAGEDIEMGGTWIHWFQPHLYGELVRYGLHRNIKTSAGTSKTANQYYKKDDSAVEEVSPDKFNEIAERVFAKVFQLDGLSSRELMPFPHDPQREPAPWKKYDYLSVQDRLNQLKDISEHEKAIFASLVNSFGSAPPEDTALVEVLRWYALGGHTLAQTFELAGNYKIGEGGMTSFALSILGDYKGDLLLKTPISRISQSSHGAVITTTAGNQVKAKYVVSTIPLNCLSDISFDPPLSPLRQEAINVGHINTGAKIHFKLSETQPGWFTSCNTPRTSPFVFGFSDHNGTQATGPSGTWCIGFGYSGQLTDKTASDQIISEFTKNLNPHADVQLYATHDWMNDPYAKGAWHCWGPGCMSKYLAELQKPEGRIQFANADWADGWRGFVDGAIERGMLAATEVRRSLENTSTAKL